MSAEKLKQMWGGVDDNVKTWLTGALAGGGIGAVGAGALSAADDRKGESKKERRTRILRQALLGGGLGAGIGSLPAGLNMIDGELNKDKTFFDPNTIEIDGETPLAHDSGVLSPISNAYNRMVNYGDEAGSFANNAVSNLLGVGTAGLMGRGVLFNTGRDGKRLSLLRELSKSKQTGLANIYKDIINSTPNAPDWAKRQLTNLTGITGNLENNKVGDKLNLQSMLRDTKGNARSLGGNKVIDALRKQLGIAQGSGKLSVGDNLKFRNALNLGGVDISKQDSLNKLLKGTSMQGRVNSGNTVTRYLGKLRGIGARGRMAPTAYLAQASARIGLPTAAGWLARKGVQGAGTLLEDGIAQISPDGHPQLTRFARNHHRAYINKALERIIERAKGEGADYKPTAEDVYKELQSSNMPEGSRPKLELIKNLLGNAWLGKEDDNDREFQESILENLKGKMWDK